MNILGNIFLNQKGDMIHNDLSQFKYIGLYFSASWCGPCRYFTPFLKKFYSQINKDSKDKFEVLFCSSDHSESDFLHYLRDMPWMAIAYNDKARLESLFRIYRPRGIPTLVIVNNQGRIISRDGRYDIEEYGIRAYDYWVSLESQQE